MGVVSNMISFVREMFAARGSTPLDQMQGTGGIAAYGGYLDNKESSADLQGPQKYVTFDNLVRNTCIIAGAVRAHDALVSGVGWSLKPGKGSNANKYAERVDQMIKDEQKTQPWNQTVGILGRYKWSGFSVLEKIAERMPDGFLAYSQFEDRPQVTVEQWYLEPQSGHVLGFVQRDPQDGQTYLLERSRCVYLADKSVSNSPEGCGMLRHVVETVRQLNRLNQLEGWAYETDLRGVPIGRAPIGVLDEMVRRKLITEADKAMKIKGLQDFIQNHVRNPQLGILLDSGVYRDEGPTKSPAVTQMWGLELAKGNGYGLAEIDVAINRKQREIARAIGWEHLMLGGDGKGSNAQHQDKTATVREVMNATLSIMAWQLDQDVIGPIFDLNGWDKTQRPTFVPDALQLRSVQEIVDALEGMARSGAVILPNDPVVNQVRDMLRLAQQPKIAPELAGVLVRGGKDPSSGENDGKKDEKKSKPEPKKEAA